MHILHTRLCPCISAPGIILNSAINHFDTRWNITTFLIKFKQSCYRYKAAWTNSAVWTAPPPAMSTSHARRPPICWGRGLRQLDRDCIRYNIESKRCNNGIRISKRDIMRYMGYSLKTPEGGNRVDLNEKSSEFERILQQYKRYRNELSDRN